MPGRHRSSRITSTASPAATLRRPPAAPAGRWRRRNARRSAEPNHGTAPHRRRRRQPRRMVRRPVGRVAERPLEQRAPARRPRSSGGPASRRSAGRTNSSKQTNELTGLPGRPKTSRLPVGRSRVPKKQRLARLQRDLVEVGRRRPASRSTPGTRSSLPAETPPDRTSTSAVRSPSSISGRRLSSRSRAMPR